MDDGFAFRPARMVIEQGDWVLWRHVGIIRSHTTTSGAGCVLNGIWRRILSPGGRFARRSLEPGGSGRYLVHRSDAPSFVGPGTTSFPPDGGAGGTTFTDAGQASAGQALFYLVANSP